ncbi:MAG: hypothetical protein AAGB02_09515 [Pseudomonadota bacterium]
MRWAKRSPIAFPPVLLVPVQKLSEINGGSFESGFLAAGFTAFAAPLEVANGDVFANAGLKAVIGGVGAELGGGKFKDGALTGAFVYLFNDAVHKIKVAKVLDVLKGVDLATASEATFEWLDQKLPRYARTVFTGVSATAGVGGGITAGYGVYWDRVTGEIGDYITVGAAVALNASASNVYGFITGSAQDFCCYFDVQEFDIGVPTLVKMYGLNSRPYFNQRGQYINDRNGVVGYAGGFGAGLGVAASATYTRTNVDRYRRAGG